MKDWKEHTRQMRAVRAGAGLGRRDEVLALRGGGIDANTLRRRIAALTFFEAVQVRDPVLAAQIDALPWTQVELLQRWSRLAPDAAYAAIPDLVAGTVTLDDLHRVVRESRARTRSPTKKSLLDVAEPRIRAAVEEVMGGDVAADPDVPAAGPACHYRYVVRTSGKVISTAVLLVGPHGNQALYKRLRMDWITRALALSWLHGRVFIAVPARDEIQGYVDALAEMSETIALRAGDQLIRPVIAALHVDVDGLRHE